MWSARVPLFSSGGCSSSNWFNSPLAPRKIAPGNSRCRHRTWGLATTLFPSVGSGIPCIQISFILGLVTLEPPQAHAKALQDCSFGRHFNVVLGKIHGLVPAYLFSVHDGGTQLPVGGGSESKKNSKGKCQWMCWELARTGQ
jgi:hypothetical protein